MGNGVVGGRGGEVMEMEWMCVRVCVGGGGRGRLRLGDAEEVRGEEVFGGR